MSNRENMRDPCCFKKKFLKLFIGFKIYHFIFFFLWNFSKTIYIITLQGSLNILGHPCISSSKRHQQLFYLSTQSIACTIH